MTLTEIIAVVASVLTIISFSGNIFQWRYRKQLLKELKARSQAAYNQFHKIADHSDKIRQIEESSSPPEDWIKIVTQKAFSINGIADAARNTIISYCREVLNFIPVKEHPGKPYEGDLPKPKTEFPDDK